MSVALNQIYSFRRPAQSPLGGPPRGHTEVGQFIILSMLLHVLFIVLFGDSSGGGSSRASQLLGGFSASLQARGTNSLGTNTPGANNIAAAPSPNGTSADAAIARQAQFQNQVIPRLVPEAENRTGSEIGPVLESPIQPLRPSLAAIPGAASSEPDKLAIPDALPALPIMSKTVVQPATAFVIPALKPAAAVVTAAAAVTAPAPAPAPGPAPAVNTLAPIDPLPRTLPLSVPKPIELNVAPSVNREFVPYVPPTLAVAPPTLPASIPTISPAAPIAPMDLPPVTPIALPSLAPPKIEREFVAPANVEVREPLVVPPTMATIAPTAQNLPRDAITGAAASASSVPPASASVSPALVGAPNAQPSLEPLRAATGAPMGAASTAQPKSVDDIFGPRRDGGSIPGGQASGSTPPAKSLDLDAARRSARESTSERSGPRTLFPFPTAPKAAVKSDVTKIFDKALKRTDCKDAYADMGLAAVIPLVRDAIKQDGCKW